MISPEILESAKRCEQITIGANVLLYVLINGARYAILVPNAACLANNDGIILTPTVAGGINSKHPALGKILAKLGLEFRKESHNNRRDLRFQKEADALDGHSHLLKFFRKLFYIAYAEFYQTLALETEEELSPYCQSEKLGKPEIIALAEMLKIFREVEDLEILIQDFSPELNKLMEIILMTGPYQSEIKVSSARFIRNGGDYFPLMFFHQACKIIEISAADTDNLEKLWTSLLCARFNEDAPLSPSLFNLVPIDRVMALDPNKANEFGLLELSPGIWVNIDLINIVRVWQGQAAYPLFLA